jgi:type I restriction enzyme R subunit
MTPEQQARAHIDQLLSAAGWVVQDRAAMDIFSHRGVALREAHMTTGYADYLLVVDQKVLGVVEAKAAGTTLSGVEEQSARYTVGAQAHMLRWRENEPLPFRYESTGVETFFTNGLDPNPRSRPVYAFHRPETLAVWAAEDESLRARLRQMPPLDVEGLWDPQITAIENLEDSLARNRPRALIQMATGSGKTFTAVNFIYRLIRHAKAKRVLFLVDRTNLGDQALNEFRQFELPGIGRKFTDDYNVQLLHSNHIDEVSKVCIGTIQRVYSILSGEEYQENERGDSLFEAEEGGDLPQAAKTVRYQPHIPIESFDFIVIDECHRSIYNIWRQVLEYFDAFLIGLTATPANRTVAYFNENKVMGYTHLDAVTDGINVNGEVFRIKTRVTETGAELQEGEWVTRRDRQTRDVEQRQLDEDFSYTGTQLGRDVINPSQIRLVLRTFRDRLFTDLFPGRSGRHVPKTLIFAKDDNHAEEIVRIAREIFDQGSDFCQKITYRTVGKKPSEILQEFRTTYHPRIAVTVDMIATGTDVQAIEALIFLRMVKSLNYFEQMRGRGTRIISTDKLQRVTADAPVKDRFVIVDAVGVTDQPLLDTSRTLERDPTVSFEKLIETVAHGAQDEETVSSLAARLARLNRRLNEDEQQQIADAAGGAPLRTLTRRLVDALDVDQQRTVAAETLAAGGIVDRPPTEAEVEAAAQDLLAQALQPWRSNIPMRTLVLEIHGKNYITYDEVNIDALVAAGYDEEADQRAAEQIARFEERLAAHQDEITALRILYNRPYAQRQLTYAAIQELAEWLKQPPHSWTTEKLWRAYAQVEKDRVRGANAPRVLTDIVALVRHAIDGDGPLEPYPEQVARRYQAWLAAQAANGRTFDARQRWWLDQIAQQIGVDLQVTPAQLNSGPFRQRGGIFAAQRDLGGDFAALLNELNEALNA